MAILGRRGSSMGRVRQQAVPAPAPAKPAGRAFGGAGKGFGSVSKAPVAATPLSQQRADVRAMAASTPKGSPVAPGSAAQAAAFNQSQQAAMKQFQGQQAAFNAANRVAPATPQQNIASLQAAKAAVAQQRPNPNMSIPMETMPSVPAASQSQIAKDITAQNDAKANAMMMQASMDAQQRFNQKQAQKAKATPAPMTQVPSPPPFRKGGAVKKKTGYAKGGAVMCGASMPPAQKRKK